MNGFILFDILSSEKSSNAPYTVRVEKKFLLNWAYRARVSKEAEFRADFKNVQKSRVWQKEKKIVRKN